MPTGDANVNGFLAGRNIGEAQPLASLPAILPRVPAEGSTLIQQPWRPQPIRGRQCSRPRQQRRAYTDAAPRCRAGPGRLPAAIAEDAQEHQEEIDEIKIQLERPDDGERATRPSGNESAIVRSWLAS